ncbi:MAG: peptide chain release factor N(5)-glutamine methyltransferase [Bacteroidota bacterium]
MTRRALLRSAAERLEAAGIDDAQRTAEWIVCEALGINRTALITDGAHDICTEAEGQVEVMLGRRLGGEPVQYILGHTEFYGLRLDVSPAVLIPRPETETVVEEALRRIRAFEAPWVLDVGTGSGAVALAIKHERPDAEVFAVDVSHDALAVAAHNAARLRLDVAFVGADALRPAFADEVPAMFDLVISNPPYVPEAERPELQTEVRDHEPHEALFVPDADPLIVYRALAGHADRLLRPGGWLIAETHADFGGAVRDLWADAGLGASILPDLAGRDRIAVAQRPRAAA